MNWLNHLSAHEALFTALTGLVVSFVGLGKYILARYDRIKVRERIAKDKQINQEIAAKKEIQVAYENAFRVHADLVKSEIAWMRAAEERQEKRILSLEGRLDRHEKRLDQSDRLFGMAFDVLKKQAQAKSHLHQLPENAIRVTSKKDDEK